MKNVLCKSMFVLLLFSVILSFGMESHRRSASDALEQQEDSKRQKSDLAVPVTQMQVQACGSLNELDVLAAVAIAPSFDQDYQNQAHSSTQMVESIPAVASASNSSVNKNMKSYRRSCGPSPFSLALQELDEIENCPRLKEHIDVQLDQGMCISQIVKTWKPASDEPIITYTPVARYIVRKNNAAAATAQ